MPGSSEPTRFSMPSTRAASIVMVARRLLEGEAVGRRHRGLEEHHARLRDVALEAALQGDRDAGLLAAWRPSPCSGSRCSPKLRAMVGWTITGTPAALIWSTTRYAFGGAVEHEPDLELLGQAQRGQDVVGPVDGDEQRHLALTTRASISMRRFRSGSLPFSGRRSALLRVLLRLDQLRPQHGDHLGPRARRLAFFALRRRRPAWPRPWPTATTVASSTSPSRGLHDHGLAGDQAPGPWPVCMVVTPKPRTQPTSRSLGL